jgi:hypothetical protein
MMSASAREPGIERLFQQVLSDSRASRSPWYLLVPNGNFHWQTERRLQHGHAVPYTVWLVEADSRSTP